MILYFSSVNCLSVGTPTGWDRRGDNPIFKTHNHNTNNRQDVGLPWLGYLDLYGSSAATVTVPHLLLRLISLPLICHQSLLLVLSFIGIRFIYVLLHNKYWTRTKNMQYEIIIKHNIRLIPEHFVPFIIWFHLWRAVRTATIHSCFWFG